MLLWKSWSQKDGKIDWWLSVPLPSKGPSCVELAQSHPPLPQPREDSLGRVPLPSWWWCRPAGVQPPACGRWEMMKKTAVLYIVKRKSTWGKVSLELRTLVWFPSQGQQVSEKGLGWSLQARVLAQDRPAVNRKQKGGNWGSPWKCPSWTLLQPERTRLQGVLGSLWQKASSREPHQLLWPEMASIMCKYAYNFQFPPYISLSTPHASCLRARWHVRKFLPSTLHISGLTSSEFFTDRLLWVRSFLVSSLHSVPFTAHGVSLIPSLLICPSVYFLFCHQSVRPRRACLTAHVDSRAEHRAGCSINICQINKGRNETPNHPLDNRVEKISIHSWSKELLRAFEKRLIQVLKHPQRRIPGEKET